MPGIEKVPGPDDIARLIDRVKRLENRVFPRTQPTGGGDSLWELDGTRLKPVAEVTSIEWFGPNFGAFYIYDEDSYGGFGPGGIDTGGDFTIRALDSNALLTISSGGGVRVLAARIDFTPTDATLRHPASSATGPVGTIVGKIAFDNGSGISGWIPVYGTIT